MENLSKSEKTFLLAIYLTSNHKIMGKVNLNKIMAFLERSGFVIEELFYEKPMGSSLGDYSFVDSCISTGFIVKDYTEMLNGYSPRVNYSLTEKGKNLIDNFIQDKEISISSLKERVNLINNKFGREASQDEHQELLYEVEDCSLKIEYFNKRKEKINNIYFNLKTEYDLITPNLNDLENMDKKGILEYILVVLNKIRKVYYGDDQDNEIILTDNTMGQYYLIRLGEIFQKEFNENDLNYLKTYNTFKKIAQKYRIFSKLDEISEEDFCFLKLD